MTREIVRSRVHVGQERPARRWRATVRYTEGDATIDVSSPMYPDRADADMACTDIMRAIVAGGEVPGFSRPAVDEEGFGYWAGPMHEADGAGHPGVPMAHKGRIVHGVDDNSRVMGAYTRRPVAGEW